MSEIWCNKCGRYHASSTGLCHSPPPGWTKITVVESSLVEQNRILRSALERIAEGAISAKDTMAFARDALLRAKGGEP